MSPPRICHAGLSQPPDPAFLAALSFDSVLLDGHRGALYLPHDRARLPDEIHLLLDIDMARLAPDHPLVQAHPECFNLVHPIPDTGLDPRKERFPTEASIVRGCQHPDVLIDWWKNRLCDLLDAGVDGFRFLNPLKSNGIMRQVVVQLRERFPEALFILDTPGVAWDALGHLEGCEFSYCLSSLPWWDLRAPWLAEEYARLRRIAPVIAMAAAPGTPMPDSVELRRTRLLLAAVAGSGVLMPMGFENGTNEPLSDTVQMMNLLAASEPILSQPGTLRVFPSAARTVVLRTADDGSTDEALVALVRRPDSPLSEFDRTVIADLEDWSDLDPIVMRQTDDALRKPGATRLFRAKRAKPVQSSRSVVQSAQKAAKEPRIIIDAIMPSVDGGRHATKRLVGEAVEVKANIFTDGHPVLAAELLYRAADEAAWQRKPMRPVGNDRWAAEMPLRRAGRHIFMVEAWLDIYGSFVRDLTKKREAGKDIRLDLEEGCRLIEQARRQAAPGVRPALDTIAGHFHSRNAEEQLALLVAPETIEVMRLADGRPFLSRSAAFPIEADRKAAGFASWYEIFPRSATSDAMRHGMFRDVIAQLPRIQAMGFDVLYMPPIHPIGITNRKGRNNALVALPDDVGSSYAIGAVEGGHDAIHPALGTFDDFRMLLAAAREHGMEIAFDFAVQCSPDHPWLKKHPGWFEWRPDGTIKYAENPPKVYEDIVNVDFYAKDAIPELWLALRDIVLFWIGEGVRIFRVDNPHTKPFSFWEWLITDVRASHPETIFLAEAFTRPTIMYHLGKIGFAQSYTYFTWRNTKSEITEYIKEITSPTVGAFFRPHFFVNTPDINPYFLQNSGRAGFLIRAALASTLSGLWGIFSGFELCEAAALPGREEYLDSDKYAVRVRDWNAPGNITAEITKLNRLRRAEPALQSHFGTTFYNAFNDSVIYYGKHPLGYRHHVLVMISLDPHHEQTTDFEIPLWEWGLPDHEVVQAEDLVSGGRFLWHGKLQRTTLFPAAPYRIWRVSPLDGGET